MVWLKGAKETVFPKEKFRSAKHLKVLEQFFFFYSTVCTTSVMYSVQYTAYYSGQFSIGMLRVKEHTGL